MEHLNNGDRYTYVCAAGIWYRTDDHTGKRDRATGPADTSPHCFPSIEERCSLCRERVDHTAELHRVMRSTVE